MAELGIISAKGRNGTAELLEIIADEQDDRIPAAGRSPGNALKPKLVNGSQFPGAQPTLWHALSPRHIRVRTPLASFASCAFSAGPPAAVFWT
jgi:hypothetical protein